jgi:DNA-binding transcriptional LysR family regulator
MLAHTDNDRVALLRAFVESARRLNFAKAAQELGLTPSTLGRRIQRLETQLGVALFVRTTRRVALTEAGTIYHAHCEEILVALEEADAAAASLGNKAVGLLRVSVPSTFARLHLTPALPEFLEQYPDIRLDITYTDQYINVVEQRIDVAVRIGQLTDSTLRARRLAPNIRRLVASPHYLAQAASLKMPEDLLKHRALHFSFLGGGDAWILERDGKEQTFPITPYLRANDALALFEAALAGQGIALLADFITGPALDDGRLLPVLTEWTVPETGIYAVYASSSFMPSKTRVFIDFLVELMASTTPWLGTKDELLGF